MKSILVAAAAAVAVVGAAHAQDAVPAAKKTPHGERRVCRTMETTGTIMPKSECHTRSEWATIDAANQANAKNFVDQQSRGGATQPH